MKKFSVKVDKLLFNGDKFNKDEEVTIIQLPSADKIYKQDVRLSYVVGESIITYYHSSYYEVYLDLTSELEKISSRNNHELSISGYPLSSVVIEKEKIEFFELHDGRSFGVVSYLNVKRALGEAQIYVIEQIDLENKNLSFNVGNLS